MTTPPPIDDDKLPPDLKILIWNDAPELAAVWANAAEKDGFTAEISTGLTVEQVVADFKRTQPEVMVLDIMADRDRGMGLKITAEIREFDLLVPIIAVSREPDSVYLGSGELEKLGFAGIFHASVMQPGVFGAIALRPSLNYWHQIVPEFALVRHGLQQLQAAFGDKESRFVAELSKMLVALPFTRSTESWHKQVVLPLQLLIQQRNQLGSLSDRFVAICQTFQKADPFYMAGTRSRRHLNHNVLVFLVGLSVLLGVDPLRKLVVAEMNGLAAEQSESKRLAEAVLLWACLANTHDTAYLSEQLRPVLNTLTTVLEKFLPFLGQRPDLKPLREFAWPSVKHGAVGADMWRSGPSEDNAGYCDLIARGIARHDSNAFPNAPVTPAQWPEFLAVLSDELQDWGRQRPDDPPDEIKWDLFFLEAFRVTRSDPLRGDAWEMHLNFVARDRPEIIDKRFGGSGDLAVRQTIGRMAKKLRDNLRADFRFEIHLTARFVSRPNELPAYEQVILDPARPAKPSTLPTSG